MSEPASRIEPLGEGHLHETFLVELGGSRSGEQLVLQCVNTQVFTDVPAVMENIARVTAHARQRLLARGSADVQRRVLGLRYTRAGDAYVTDAAGRVFRVFDYVADSIALSRIERAEDAFEAGRALGEFFELMADLPAPPLHVTLPDFHAPERRFLQLEAALADDPVGRAGQVQTEWRAIAQRKALAYECDSWTRTGEIPLRVAHNDAKLNNVLFDRQTRRALCVVDLDTVMPGYLAFDFGDLVRTCACTAAEDSRDLSQVGLQLEHFEALATGYLGEVRGRLTPREHASLARGAAWIVLELAMRFLSDYVRGDAYFKIARPDDNLVRARVQLALLDALERRAPDLTRVLERLA